MIGRRNDSIARANSIFRTMPANAVALFLKWFQNVMHSYCGTSWAGWSVSSREKLRHCRQPGHTLWGGTGYYEHGTLAAQLPERRRRGCWPGRRSVRSASAASRPPTPRRSGLQARRHHRDPQHLPLLLGRLRRHHVFQGRSGERRDGGDHPYRGRRRPSDQSRHAVPEGRGAARFRQVRTRASPSRRSASPAPTSSKTISWDEALDRDRAAS